MSIQEQLDPLSRNLLAAIGRACIALATGEVDLPHERRMTTPLDIARAQLRGQDGQVQRVRRVLTPRRCYSVKPVSANKQADLTPAARRVVKALSEKKSQTAPDLADATGLSRKTVENILSTLNSMKVLVREDVLGTDQ